LEGNRNLKAERPSRRAGRPAAQGKLPFGRTGINALATLGYPPEMRSSGIGWAGGWGRIAGIVLPAWAGAKALEMLLPLQTVMALIALPAIVVAVLILALGISNGGKIGVRQAQLEPKAKRALCQLEFPPACFRTRLAECQRRPNGEDLGAIAHRLLFMMSLEKRS
jgi:hypothetical protein